MYSRWAPITNEQPPQQFPIIILTNQQHTRLSSVYHQLWNFTQASDLCRVEPPTSSPTTEYPSVTATVATTDRLRTILPIAKPHELGKLHWVMMIHRNYTAVIPAPIYTGTVQGKGSSFYVTRARQFNSD